MSKNAPIEQTPKYRSGDKFHIPIPPRGTFVMFIERARFDERKQQYTYLLDYSRPENSGRAVPACVIWRTQTELEQSERAS